MRSRIVSTALLISGLFSCSSDPGKVENISRYDSIRSHNNGQVCLRCHGPQGNGKGHFTVAGSVYRYNQRDPHPAATVRLYSEDFQQGQLLLQIEVDKKGNFYTTEAVDMLQPVYPVVYASDGNHITEMNMPAPSGACNSCHDQSPVRIWVR